MILETTTSVEEEYDLGVTCEVLTIWEVDGDFCTDLDLADLKEEGTPLKSIDWEFVLGGMGHICRRRFPAALGNLAAPPSDICLLGGDLEDEQIMQNHGLILSQSPLAKVAVRILLDKAPVTGQELGEQVHKCRDGELTAGGWVMFASTTSDLWRRPSVQTLITSEASLTIRASDGERRPMRILASNANLLFGQPRMEVAEAYEELARSVANLAWKREMRRPDHIPVDDLDWADRQFHDNGTTSQDIEQGFLVYHDQRYDFDPTQIEDIWPGICWGARARDDRGTWVYHGESEKVTREAGCGLHFCGPGGERCRWRPELELLVVPGEAGGDARPLQLAECRSPCRCPEVRGSGVPLRWLRGSTTASQPNAISATQVLRLQGGLRS